MLIVPGDQVGIKFGSEVTPFEGIRLQPDIHSSALPSPMKERYQTPSGVRLPCNDMKISDSMVCQDTYIYCTDPNDDIKM